MNPAGFKVSDSCVECGRCVKVCPGGILYMGEDGRPRIGEFEGFGWNGCWQCEHCLAVCNEPPFLPQISEAERAENRHRGYACQAGKCSQRRK